LIFYPDHNENYEDSSYSIVTTWTENSFNQKIIRGFLSPKFSINYYKVFNNNILIFSKNLWYDIDKYSAIYYEYSIEEINALIDKKIKKIQTVNNNAIAKLYFDK
jgi:hypothetical protein